MRAISLHPVENVADAVFVVFLWELGIWPKCYPICTPENLSKTRVLRVYAPPSLPPCHLQTSQTL